MEDAGKLVMEEFGFCPSWGFLEPEPLETLGSPPSLHNPLF